MSGKVPFAVPGTNTTTPTTVVSTLGAAHSHGKGIFGFLNSKTLRRLRATSSELRNAVADFPLENDNTSITTNIAAWYKSFPNARKANFLKYRGGVRQLEADARAVPIEGGRTLLDKLRELSVLLVNFGPIIDGSVAAWRAANPDALAANLSNRNDITDDDFQHLRELRALNMSGCRQPTITDAAFAHLRGVHTLWMGSCNQPTITDAAFAHLAGIHELSMFRCRQITDAAFANLRGIHTLDMAHCNQPTITDAAFENLEGIHTLNMVGCNQQTITSNGIGYLRGAKSIVTSGCSLEVREAAERLLRRGGKRKLLKRTKKNRNTKSRKRA